MRLLKYALAAGCVLSAPALSHIVFDKEEGTTDGYYAGILRVSHGCGASPTRSIRIVIPEEIISARPQPKAGWTITIEKEPLKQPMTGEGGRKITERVKAISWTGNLPNDQFEQFGIMMKLPAKAGPLYFPTTQTCETGRNDWTTIPASPEAWHDVENPAPMLIVKATAAHDPHAGHGS